VGLQVNATDVDLVFAKIKEKAARRISYDKYVELKKCNLLARQVLNYNHTGSARAST
jgi:hypothetical protein